MARLLYALAFYLATPLIWLRLLWRARKQPEYLQHLGERYGYYPQAPQKPLIWLHAVSVGETRAAASLIDALLQAYPAHALLLTHMTPTGRKPAPTTWQSIPAGCFRPICPTTCPTPAVAFLATFSHASGYSWRPSCGPT